MSLQQPAYLTNLFFQNWYHGPSPEMLKKIHYVVADSGFSSKNLYDLSLKRGFELVCSVKRHKIIPHKQDKLLDFFKKALKQVSTQIERRISIEPLIKHIKFFFRIDQVPIKGLDKLRYIFLLSVLFCKILVYYTCRLLKNYNP